MDEEYIKRVNTILLFIDENLDSELSLEIVANVGFYSPFHFHRIFKAITNETLNSYITRKRIEKTASILLHQKNVSITELLFNTVSIVILLLPERSESFTV